MTEVYFVRHAQPNYDNHDDMNRELTEKGRADCGRVVDFFKRVPVDQVLSSPFRRAVETVRGVAEARGMEVRIVDGFRERRVDSAWIEDFNGFARRQWEDFDFKLADGECLSEVQRRNVAALNGVIGEFPGKCAVVGSHGTALSTIINNYQPDFGYDDFARIQKLMPWVVRFDFSGDKCVRIRGYDLFACKEDIIYEGGPDFLD